MSLGLAFNVLLLTALVGCATARTPDPLVEIFGEDEHNTAPVMEVWPEDGVTELATESSPIDRTPRSLDVRATVSLADDDRSPHRLMLTVRNPGSQPVTFLDVPEGQHNHCWRIEIRTPSGRLFKPDCVYAPASEPVSVTLKPGETWRREFNTIAYVAFDSIDHYSLDDELCEVKIHYRHTSHDIGGPPFVTFSSEPVTLRLSDLFYESYFKER